jgi:hypothetical protein
VSRRLLIGPAEEFRLLLGLANPEGGKISHQQEERISWAASELF